MLRPVAARLVAAVVLTAAASLALPAAPASAAACAGADGVSVVVDFHELGGGLQQVCAADGADRAAAELFPESGFPLTYVQRQPGFVCRVSGAPAEDPCQNTPPADAYWGVWWSDGKSGSWKYSTEGVGSLSVPDGGSVALSWNGSSTKSPPGAAPPANAAEPSPSPSTSSPQPSPSPPSSPSGGGGPQTPTAPATSGGVPAPTGGASTSAGADPSAGPSTGRAGRHQPGSRKDAEKADDKNRDQASSRAKPSGSASTPGSATAPAPVATSDPADSADGGLPVWVAPLGIAVLFAAAAGTAVVRRRRGNPGP